MKTLRRICIFTIDTTGMSAAALVEFGALVGVAPQPGSAKFRAFHVEITEMSHDQVNELAIRVFNNHGASSIGMATVLVCQYCALTKTLYTGECGDYGKGSCDVSP